MSTRTGRPILSTLLAAAVLCFAALSYGQEPGGNRERRSEDYLSHQRGGFSLGVCVGQQLAQQGIVLPPPAQGEHYLNPTGDATTEQAIQSAAQMCRTQFRTPPSPSPSPAGSATPVPGSS
ncbi:MAG: hypothetical protein P4M08_04030 [Oligoflexia bacterium]|nr:hypothetical protein [Oligoflexia bacterium]